MRPERQREIYEILLSGYDGRPGPAYDRTLLELRRELLRNLGWFSDLDATLEDVVQVTLIKITSPAIEKVSNPDRFLFWCFRIAANLARQQFRYCHWSRTDGGDAADHLVDGSQDTADQSALAERLSLLEESLQLMQTSTGGQALYLRAVHGWSYDRIATHLGISSDAARAQVARLRRRLRQDSDLYDRFKDLTDG